LTWFEVAAREGHGIALFELAGMYQDGVGTYPSLMQQLHLLQPQGFAASFRIHPAHLGKLDCFTWENLTVQANICVSIFFLRDFNVRRLSDSRVIRNVF
jgi:hypothetical protein